MDSLFEPKHVEQLLVLVYYLDQRMHNIQLYTLTIFYTSQVLLHIPMHPHHLQGVLSFYFAEVTKIINITKLIKSVY